MHGRLVDGMLKMLLNAFFWLCPWLFGLLLTPGVQFFNNYKGGWG